MTVVSVLEIIAYLAVFPLLVGSFPMICRQLRQEDGAGVLGKGLEALLWGYFVMMAVFEVLCIPFIILQKPFSSVCKCYFIVSIGEAVFSVLLSIWMVRKEKKRNRALRRNQEYAFINRSNIGTYKGVLLREKGLKIALYLVFLGIVLFQMWYVCAHQHYDGDDSYYVSQSVIAQEMDSMYVRDVYTGLPLGGIDTRHALAAFPMYVAYLANQCDMHATVMAHTVMAPLFLFLMYGAYILLAQQLLRKLQPKLEGIPNGELAAPLCLILLSIWYMFGNVSLYTAETFAFTRTWQGKALFGNLLIPMIVWVLLRIYDAQEGLLILYLELIVATVTGVLFTTAAVYLLPILVGLFALFTWIVQKREGFKKALCTMLCLIPVLVMGMVYYLIK